jgi:hypothetical protein
MWQISVPHQDPDPFVRGMDPYQAPILPFSHKGVARTEIMLAKKNFKTKFLRKIKFLRLKIMCLPLKI